MNYIYKYEDFINGLIKQRELQLYLINKYEDNWKNSNDPLLSLIFYVNLIMICL